MFYHPARAEEAFRSPSQPQLCLGTQGMSSVSLLRAELEAVAMGTLEMVVAEIIEPEVSFPQRK